MSSKFIKIYYVIDLKCESDEWAELTFLMYKRDIINDDVVDCVEKNLHWEGISG